MAQPEHPEVKMPAYTMLFDQSAHMDWDWIRTFAQNYWYYSNGRGVNQILANGINAAERETDYHYTICEIGFLRQFIETSPQYAEKIKSLGEKIQIVGGGVVSPDCLVSSSEGFIRNYLIGQTWLKTTLGVAAKPHCWLPDDFGQGPELSVLLKALGFVSVIVSRVPGLAASDLFADGLDIMWQAKDGSQVLLHYVGVLYNQSGPLQNPNNYVALDQIRTIIDYYTPDPTNPQTYKAATGAFMYWPIMDDFSQLDTPIPNLRSRFKAWNDSTTPEGSPNATETNVGLRYGTFDSYVTGLMKQPDRPRTMPYNGTPLWTGYFASRPDLKALHYETTRALVAAEVIGLLTQPSSSALRSMLPKDFWTRIEQVWTDFVPSTHHDFITGTASDGVYMAEQLPLLRGTAEAARSLRAAALNALAGMTSTATTRKPSMIVANSLGFTRSGVAQLDEIVQSDEVSPGVEVEYFPGAVQWDNNNSTLTQRMNDGGMAIFVPEIKSFGYNIGSTVKESSPIENPPKSEFVTLTGLGTGNQDQVTINNLGDVYTKCENPVAFTLSNSWLRVTINAESQWGIATLVDLTNSAKENNILEGGKVGNKIIFYNESKYGDIYQFGNEKSDDDGKPYKLLERQVDVLIAGPGLGAVVTEVGPLLTKIRTEVLFKFSSKQFEKGMYNDEVVVKRFVREYELRAGEPFLRMTTTGAAPRETAVMTTFPLASQVDGITHGTGYHWTDVQPASGYWDAPVFRATHDFLIPYVSQEGGKKTLAAFYHDAMPAWAVDADSQDERKNGNVIMGCLLRNSTIRKNDLGAVGTDPAPHTQRYAIRVPSHLGEPTTCKPLQEAQSFHTPLLAVRMPEGAFFEGMIEARRGFLAEPRSEGNVAMITVAKPGARDSTDLVLRIYQSSNSPLDVNLKFPTQPSSAAILTATESEWKGEGSIHVYNDNSLDVRGAGTISTVSIPRLGRASNTK